MKLFQAAHVSSAGLPFDTAADVVELLMYEFLKISLNSEF